MIDQNAVAVGPCRELTMSEIHAVAGGAVNQSGGTVPDGRELIKTIQKIIKIVKSLG